MRGCWYAARLWRVATTPELYGHLCHGDPEGRAADGTPFLGLSITDTILRTREGFVVFQEPSGPGVYVVFHDGLMNRIRGEGDPVRVVAANDTIRVAADFVFAIPDGCHVAKVAGPDSVIVP